MEDISKAGIITSGAICVNHIDSPKEAPALVLMPGAFWPGEKFFPENVWCEPLDGTRLRPVEASEETRRAVVATVMAGTLRALRIEDRLRYVLGVAGDSGVPTQEHLALLIGSRRETVSINLRTLRESGEVRVHKPTARHSSRRIVLAQAAD